MNRAAAKARVALLLDRLWVAVVLSALYPTIFALSGNWYAIGTEKIIWLVAVAVAAGLAVYLLVEIVVAAIGSILAVASPAARDLWVRFVRASLFAAACTAIFFVLLTGTLAMSGVTGVAVAFIAAAAGMGVLFVKGLQLRSVPLSQLRGSRLVTMYRFAQPSLFAAACAAILFVLLAGTLGWPLSDLKGEAVAFMAVAAGMGVLFAKGLQRYFNMALGLLTVVAIGSWLLSFGEYLIQIHAADTLITRKGDLKPAKFAEMPNIYLFVYDAYGSDAAYRKVFGFDNSPHYRALGERGFKVVHTFSNYRATWPTTLSVFLGRHHYYAESSGRDDTKVGRNLMAGLAHNPVFENLWSRGYRIQQIQRDNYLVLYRGKLDYLFPEPPIYSALMIYSSPVLTRLFGKKIDQFGGWSIEEQSEVLLSHLPDPPGPEVHPWLTFSHISLPGHSPKKNWLALEGFEKDYVERTVTANEHMLSVMDAIVAKDPSAIVVIFGDHGAWRYRGVWTHDADTPNRAFEKAGVEPEIVTNDIFGVMIAVRSAGRCDDYVYPSVTPVNIMRVVFACLTRQPKLLENRADDISLINLSGTSNPWEHGQNWLVAKDGRALPQWLLYDRPEHDLGSVP